jgi:hypothetical protein
VLLGQQYNESIFFPNNNGGYYFGSSTILRDSIMFIGYSRDSINGFPTGSLYFYKKMDTAWNFIKKILPDSIGRYDCFFKPYLAGNYLFVGTFGWPGIVFCFEYSNGDWIQKQKLLGDSSYWYSHFGEDISVLNDELFVGAFGDDTFFDTGGAVYILKRENGQWVRQKKLFPKIPKDFAAFGWQVAAANSHLFISANWESSQFGNYAGAVYVYEKMDSSWYEQQILYPDTTSVLSLFGSSLATDGKTLIVGAPGANAGPGLNGVVYVFSNGTNGWVQTAKLKPPISTPNDYYGYSLSYYEGYLLVGAPGDIFQGERTASSYLYKQVDSVNWQLVKKIIPSDTSKNDRFGEIVSLNKGNFLIGAPDGNNPNNVRTGCAYLYTPRPNGIEEDKFYNFMEFRLEHNYPNPFNPITTISWQSPVGSHQTLKVYDVLGRGVATLVNEWRDAGRYSVEFNASNLASGLYIYQLRVNPSTSSGQSFVASKKLLMIK